MLKNGRLEIVATGMLLACSTFSLGAQQLPATAPTGVVAAEGADAAVAVVAPAARHPNPPHVKCAGDELTIEADNSLLSSVLDAVHACIGAKIALPEGAVDGLVFFQFGPGRTRDVLNSLLSETDLDYVVLSAPGAPEKVVTVELIARTPDVRGANAPIVASNGPMTPARLAWMAARNLGRGMPPSEESTVEPASKDSGTGSSASADHADASPAVGTSPQSETRAAAADASASTNAAAVDAGAPAITVAADVHTSTNSPAAENAAPGSGAVGTTTAETPTIAVPADSTATTPAENELKHKITDMQQLFEQRKKLNAAPAAAPDSNAAATPSPS